MLGLSNMFVLELFDMFVLGDFVVGDFLIGLVWGFCSETLCWGFCVGTLNWFVLGRVRQLDRNPQPNPIKKSQHKIPMPTNHNLTQTNKTKLPNVCTLCVGTFVVTF